MSNPNEPRFELRAQDQFMPQVLEYWATLVEQAVKNTVSETAPKSRDKAKNARALAHTVRAWQMLHPHKIPD